MTQTLTGPATGNSTPAHSPEIEQSLLGTLIFAPALISNVMAVLDASDFYNPNHSTLFDVLCDLSENGAPVHPPVLISRLRDLGELDRLGGPGFIASLSRFSLPSAAMHMAEEIREKSNRRRLAALHHQQIHRASSGQDITSEDLISEAQTALDEIAEQRGVSQVGSVGTALEDTLDEIERLGNADGGVTGLSTGFYDLDRMTYGLHPGQMICIAARPGVGKALALETPLPTPTGWTTMGEVQVGDHLLDRDGQRTRVTAATQVMLDRPCYEVEFSDGEILVADAEHQWLTQTRRERQGRCEADASVRTTEEIAQTLRFGADQRLNHSVPIAAPLDLPEADLLVGPYTLGAWLGDGSSAGNAFTSETSEIPMEIEAEGYVVKHHDGFRYGILLPEEQVETRTRECVICRTPFTPRLVHVETCGKVCGGHLAVRNRGNARMPQGCPDCGGAYVGLRRCQACHLRNGTFKGHLRQIGVLGDKHIPAVYLRASATQRRALLAGLLDTDGTVTASGSVALALTSKRLADDAYELIVSLGYRASRTTKPVKGRTEATSTSYITTFSTPDPVFRLARKDRAHNSRRAGRPHYASRRYVVAVRPIDSVPVRCVEVDNGDHLYLAGRAMVPTHNSTLGLDICRSVAVRQNKAAAFFSLEMNRTEILMRMLSAECRVDLGKIRSGNLDDRDWQRLADKTEAIKNSPLYIDDTPGLTMGAIRAQARRLKQRYDLQLLTIDYLQLVTLGKSVNSRQEEVSTISRQCKLIAKELQIPVIVMSQLNRGNENRTDPRPKMSDLRESGAIEQDSDAVILIHREEMYDPETARVGEADLIIPKQRSASTGVCTLLMQGQFSRFTDLAQV